jgi:hypothetical protein
MTTVGYGDELPTTHEAKVLAMVLMLVGIGYFAVITGAIAERFIESGEEERIEAVEADAGTTSPPKWIGSRCVHANLPSSLTRCGQRSPPPHLRDRESSSQANTRSYTLD